MPGSIPVSDSDPAHRKLFVRGLGWDITVEALKAVFIQYGDVDECSVIKDKQTDKSKGYGFVTFKHMDAARRALKEPNKKIEGRVTVSQLASIGPSMPSNDQTGRKIYVGNVPHDLSADKLLSVFAQFGDVEEGPLGFDKVSGKSKDYALFVYKSAESAKRALKEPSKTVDEHQVNCNIRAPSLETKGHLFSFASELQYPCSKTIIQKGMYMANPLLDQISLSW